MLELTDRQRAEIGKYTVSYSDPKYRMGEDRARSIRETLKEVPYRMSYLDVSCGRGEMLQFAKSLGFGHVAGTEVVPQLVGRDVRYALAWDLPFPDGSFEVVSFLDVVEHLLPGDDERACREVARVASRTILITANNRDSIHNGMQLHVNKRSYEEWSRLFSSWFPGRVTWLRHRTAKNSELWRVDLP